MSSSTSSKAGRKSRSPEPETPPKPKDLSRPIRQHIVAFVLRKPEIMAQVRSCLNPVHFEEDETLSDILAWVLVKWDEFKELPSKRTLKDTFRKTEERDLINRLWKDDISDPKLTVARVRDHAHSRAMRLAVMRSAVIINAENRGEVPREDDGQRITDDPETLMKAANLVGRETTDIGRLCQDALEDDIEQILHPRPEDLMSTGIGLLDQCGMALAATEVGVILGAPKAGKSHMLLNLGYQAARKGANVMYYSFEMSAERIRNRLQRRVVGRGGDLKRDPERFVRLLRKRWAKQMVGDFRVKRWPAYSAGFNDIRAHMQTILSSGRKVDLMLVDYVGIMKPDRPTGEVRHDLDQLWVDFRAVCGEFNVRGWSCAQANRSAVDKERVTMQDFAEHFGIVRHIDAGFSICSTQEMRDANTLKLFGLASRNERDGFLIDCEFDWSRSWLKTIGMSESTQTKRSKDTSVDADREGEQFERALDKKRKLNDKAMGRSSSRTKTSAA